MTTQARPLSGSVSTMRSGTVTLILAVLFAGAVAFTYALSLGEGVNPPHWVRVIGLVWLPIGLAGVPVGYATARVGDGRGRATVGVVVGAVALLACIALVIAIG